MAPSSFHAAAEWGQAIASLQQNLTAKPGFIAASDLSPRVMRWFTPDPDSVVFLPELSRIVSRWNGDGEVRNLHPLKPMVLSSNQEPYLYPISDRYRWRD